ncbi:MAG: hypothetical protein AAF193_03120 [Bacteroidota bacterium]
MSTSEAWFLFATSVKNSIAIANKNPQLKGHSAPNDHVKHQTITRKIPLE